MRLRVMRNANAGGGAPPADPATGGGTPPATPPAPPEDKKAEPDVKALQRELKKAQDEAKAYREAEEKRKQDSMSELERERARAEKAEAEKKTISERANDTLKRAAVMAAAAAAGAVDAADIYHLADKSGLEIDANGDVKGAAELVEGLKKAKPHLFGQKPPVNIGDGGGNPGTTPGGSVGPEAFRNLKGQELIAFMDRVRRGEVKLK